MSEFLQVLPLFFIPVKYRNYEYDEKGGGEGSLGTVKKFDHPSNGTSVAIKKFSKPHESGDRYREIMRERDILNGLRNENVVTHLKRYTLPYGATTPDSYYHITEWGGELLSSRIRDGWQVQYSMTVVQRWTREMLRGVNYLHSKNIAYTNLHPRNICVGNRNQIILLSIGKMTQQLIEAEVRHYAPPEQLVVWKDKKLNSKVDVWRIGAILCELIAGQPLFSGDTLKKQMRYCGRVYRKFLRKVERGRDRKKIKKYARRRESLVDALQSNILEGRSIKQADKLKRVEGLTDFLKKTLRLNPEDRSSTSKALSHPFLKIVKPYEAVFPGNPAEEMAALRALMDQELGVLHDSF